jgi:hypothetical protein
MFRNRQMPGGTCRVCGLEYPPNATFHAACGSRIKRGPTAGEVLAGGLGGIAIPAFAAAWYLDSTVIAIAQTVNAHADLSLVAAALFTLGATAIALPLRGHVRFDPPPR